ncbi:hypothetical protein TUMSATVNIG1_34210 [Vibrio nigripulchritudo]|nr:hypothetical protein VNTUMSATTG_33920 [Vibrio nigripulchritudo]BDU32812.1 hypothetical protein TUMSATVNIG1_34210 [Vibrio nigripulchritudo]
MEMDKVGNIENNSLVKTRLPLCFYENNHHLRKVVGNSIIIDTSSLTYSEMLSDIEVYLDIYIVSPVDIY